MKHRVEMDVVTEKKGFFGTRQVVERKTMLVDGSTYRKMQREAREREAEEEERQAELAAAGEYLMWEEELADILDE